MPASRDTRQPSPAEGVRKNCRNADDYSLLVTRLDKGSPLVITALWADRVGRDRAAALRAISDLTLLDVIVAAAFAGSTVAVFSLRDSHGCLGGKYGVVLN